MIRARWLLTFALLLPAPLLADDARELFQRGSKALSAGNAAEALAAFEAAYKAEPAPSLYFWIGEAHFALGHKARAARNYKLYLAKLPNGPNKAKAQARLEELKAPSVRKKSRRKVNLAEIDLGKITEPPPPTTLELPPAPGGPAGEGPQARAENPVGASLPPV